MAKIFCLFSFKASASLGITDQVCNGWEIMLQNGIGSEIVKKWAVLPCICMARYVLMVMTRVHSMWISNKPACTLTSYQSCRFSTKPLNNWTVTELLASCVTHEASFPPDLCFVSTASTVWDGIKQSWNIFCRWHLSNIPLPNRVGWVGFRFFCYRIREVSVHTEIFPTVGVKKSDHLSSYSL